MTLLRALVGAAALASTIVVAPPAAASSSDFSVSLAGPDRVQVGDTFLYELVVRHEGKGFGSTQLAVRLPSYLVVTGRTADRGSCTYSDHAVDCSFDKIAGDKPATVTLGVYASSSGAATTSAALAPDAVASNNTASLTTTAIQPPPPTQTFAAPYENAYGTAFGSTDAATGRFAIAVPAGCTADCRGASVVDQRLTLSGVGPRTADVDVVLDVEQIRETVATGADVDAMVTMFRVGDEEHSCFVDLDPVAQPAATGRVAIRCSWPTPVDGGSPLVVRAAVLVHAQPLVQVEAHGVFSSITVSGAPASS